MRGSIFKQKGQADGSWTIVLELERDPVTNKRHQKWVTFKGNKHQAEERLAELRHEQMKGTLSPNTRLTVRDYLTRWLAESAKPSLTPASYVRYSGIVNGHLIPAFSNVQLAQLRPEHVQKHYTAMLERGLSARSIHYDHIVLHGALRLAVKWGLVGQNVADAVETPRPRRSEMLTWDKDEINVFLEAAKQTPFYAVFFTALYSGMRRSELLALTWRHVDFLFCQISVERRLHRVHGQGYVYTEPKSAKSRRMIAMSPFLVLVLKEQRAKQEVDHLMTGNPLTEDSLVFARPDGTPLFPNSVSRAWNLLAKKAGVKSIRFHDARHSHATILLKQGVHPKIVQERLGVITIVPFLRHSPH